MVTRLNIITARDGLIMMIKSKWIRRGMENEGRITGLRFRVAFGNNYCLLKVTKTCQVCVTILVTGKSEANLANLRRFSDLQRLDGTLNWNLSHVNQTRLDQGSTAALPTSTSDQDHPGQTDHLKYPSILTTDLAVASWISWHWGCHLRRTSCSSFFWRLPESEVQTGGHMWQLKNKNALISPKFWSLK